MAIAILRTMRNLQFLNVVFLSLMVACVSKKLDTKATSSTRVLHWETKANIKDLKEKKNHNIHLDILTQNQSHLRMEVSALLGYPVASLLVTPNDLKLAIHTQKRFYTGRSDEGSLKGFMNFPIEPKNIIQLVGDQPLKGWSCDKGLDGLLARCSLRGEVLVAWTERKANYKRVTIRAPNFEMDWRFESREEVVDPSPQIFVLEPNKNYNVIQL